MHTILLCLTILPVISAWTLFLNPHEERLLNRRAGDNFLVVCKVKDFDGAASDVKVDWYKNGKLIPRFGSMMTIERTYSSQLMINRPKTSDGGTYVCKADINGEEQEISATISFVDPPKFIDPQTEQHPEEGTRAQIICKVEGTEQLEVFWQFNGVTLDESSQRGYAFSDDKQTLIIPHYTAKKDDGVYSCNAAQYSSFETLSINVTGYARPTITVFDVPSGNRGYEGHSVELKCGAVGKPKPTYKWYFESQEVEIEDSDKHKVEEGLLVVESLSEDDAGTYKCIANNSVGTDEKTVELSVYLRPKVEVVHEYVKKEGENVEITCKYEGEGNLRAKFVYAGQEFTVVDEPEPTEVDVPEASEESPEETTTTADVSEENEEDNLSEAETTTADDVENSEETEQETTTTAPTSQEDQEHEEEEAEEAKRWKRFVDDVNSARVSIRGEDGKLFLTIRQVSLEDAGAYSCLVSNEAGTTNKTSMVNIIHPPTLRQYSGPRVRSYDGNTVTIFCDVSAVPAPTWKWYKDGGEVEANGASVQIDSEGTHTKIRLEHGKGDDNYGRYTCKADNGVGVFEKQIEVVHVVRPATPTGMDCKQSTYPNFGRCSFEEGLYDEESTRPLEIQFLISKIEDMESDFDWNDAFSVKIPFANQTTITDLTPNTQYTIKARAINEAGESEYTEEVSLETTDPWAPQSPQAVRMECSESCVVAWTEPNDHGSPITGYRITVQELGQTEPAEEQHKSEEVETTTPEDEENDDEEEESETTTPSDDSEEVEATTLAEESNEETEEEQEEATTTSNDDESEEDEKDDNNNEEKERVPIGSVFIVEVGPDNHELELTHIKPHSYYRIAVAAINAVGQGEPLEIEHQTDDSPTHVESGISTHNLLLAAALGLFFLIAAIDVLCYFTNRCGLIACVCLNCCGRSNDRKERDLEAGRGPESNRLLDNNASR